MEGLGGNFRFRTNKSKDLIKQKYRIYLQKAKILYFNQLQFNKKSIRKNSELLSDFNIFKIKKKHNTRYQRFFNKNRV